MKRGLGPGGWGSGRPGEPRDGGAGGTGRVGVSAASGAASGEDRAVPRARVPDKRRGGV